MSLLNLMYENTLRDIYASEDQRWILHVEMAKGSDEADNVWVEILNRTPELKRKTNGDVRKYLYSLQFPRRIVDRFIRTRDRSRRVESPWTCKCGEKNAAEIPLCHCGIRRGPRQR